MPRSVAIAAATSSFGAPATNMWEKVLMKRNAARMMSAVCKPRLLTVSVASALCQSPAGEYLGNHSSRISCPALRAAESDVPAKETENRHQSVAGYFDHKV